MNLPAPTSIDLASVSETHEAYVSDPHTSDGSFRNPWGAFPQKGLPDVIRWKLVGNNVFRSEKKRPPDLPVADRPNALWDEATDGARVQWLGHASVLVELDGKVFLIDPIFGKAGPVVRRHVPAPRLPSELPRIDAILISHGHYDHLDVPSIRAVLKHSPDAILVVPTGLARVLSSVHRKIVEISWWQTLNVGDNEVISVPAQHWHRRGLFDTNRALWGGWVVRGSRTIYHSGDTGYFGGFRTIREVLGPPDVAILPLGAYEPRWFMNTQHMSPEDSLRAFVDLGARHFLAMHWGTFDLTDEPMDHGAFTLLPQIAAERELPSECLHVLGHGGVLGFAREEIQVLGAASKPTV